LRVISGDRELELFTRKVLVIGAAVAVGAMLWYARAALVLIFIAAIIAAGIAPSVRRVRMFWRYHFCKRLPQGAAVMIVYLPFLLAVILIGIVVVPRFVVETQDLGARLPALIEENILAPLEQYVPVDVVRQELRNGVELPRSRVFAYMRNVGVAIGSVFAVLFMVAYMLIDGDRLRNLFLLIYPPGVRGERRATMRRISRRMSAWLSGQLLLCAIIGVTTFVGMLALRLPYAVPLAIIAAVGELIPVLGPTVSAVPILAVALLHSDWQFWAALVFMIVLQKVENLFIVPRVMSKKVSVSPLAIFVAFLLGASLLGVAGAILAIPVAAIAQVAFEEAFVARRERRQDVERPGTLLRKAD
jgi:predicted PurR-regulated permease PerM